MDINRSYMVDLFLKYVSFDTTSDPESTAVPSTQKQVLLAKEVASDCRALGLSNIVLHENGYTTATLKANIEGKGIPAIGFLAHLDTTPDASGKNIKPRIIEKYTGKDIELGNGYVLSANEFPALKNCIGKDLIVTDGTTLLGADDKAGIAAIMAALSYLTSNPEIKHGDIHVAFTPDEEIGTGMNHFNVEDFHADFGYTIDGGSIGSFNYENFNAAKVRIKITGKSVHPGSAKGIMINAGLIAAEIITCFPTDETPQTTEERQGFYHLSRVSGSVEESVIDYIIRDHDKEKLNKRKEFVQNIAKKFNDKYGNIINLTITDQYFNMKEMIDQNPQIIDLALNAYKNVVIKPIVSPVRGGTDGANLSFRGLPCPNIFYGGSNAHGPYEYAVIDDMIKSAEVIVEISRLNADKI